MPDAPPSGRCGWMQGNGVLAAPCYGAVMVRRILIASLVVGGALLAVALFGQMLPY